MGEQQLRATRRQHNHLQKTPTQIPNLTNVTSLSSGYYSDYALKSDGTVWSWGYNGDGQLGDNTTTTRLTPIQIPNLTNIASISSKYYSAYVLKSDGTVWSWGYNSYGQLGDNTTINKSAPTQIPNLANVTSLASGYYSDYALKADGTVWSWGHNTYWQLCDGTTTDKWESIQINGLALESALTAPTELSINNITSSTLTLAWTLQSGGGATSYKIYKNNQYLATSTTPTYTATNLIPSTSYSFTITASNPSGDSPKSAPISVTTTTAIPSTPTNLTATNITPSTFKLSWAQSTSATHYNIYKNSVLIGTTSSLEYTVPNLEQETNYSFTITASNESTSSLHSQPTLVTTQQQLNLSNTQKMQVQLVSIDGTQYYDFETKTIRDTNIATITNQQELSNNTNSLFMIQH